MSVILFVDDEPKVLSGLKRLLAGHRGDWDMRFVASGREALEIMAGVDVDVLVTDLLMPGMNGVELLEEVVRRWPHVIRVVLSGYSDRDMILESVRLAHRFLFKPCDPLLLEDVLTQAQAGCCTLAEREMWRKVASMTVLPVVSEIKVGLDRELAREEPSMERLAAMVSQEVALAAKCMNLVNSSSFQAGGPVASLERGVGMLGADVLRSLCLSMNVFTAYDASARPGFSLGMLWEHSLRTARLARTLARDDGGDDLFAGEVYTCALLHDVGKLVMAQGLPDEFCRILALARERGKGLEDAERAASLPGHARIGACLLHLWGLPETVVDVVAGHHPGQDNDDPPRHLPFVCAANMLDHEFCHITPDRPQRVFDETPFCRWGLGDRLPRWRELAGHVARGCA